jgi:hypothetical protein
VELSAAVLFSGADGATLYMDELRVIVAQPPALAPTLLAPADGACVPTNMPLLVWDCTDPAVTNFSVVLDGAPQGVGAATQLRIGSPLSEASHTWYVIAEKPGAAATSSVATFSVDTTPPDVGSAAFISPVTDASWLEGSLRTPRWTTTGISDANLDSNNFSLSFFEDPGYATIVPAFNGMLGSYDWYIAGIPRTYSNTHLRLTVRDTAGNTTALDSPTFHLVDQGEVKTSAWRYVTVYPFDDEGLDGFRNGSRAHVSWDSSNAFAGAGCLRATLVNSGGWVSSTYKPDVSADANWAAASSLRLRAKFPADMGYPGVSRVDMIWMFWTNNVEHRQTLTLDDAWHQYEFPLNSNFFRASPVAMTLVLQSFSGQLKVGDAFLMDEVEIYTWDEVIPEPGAVLVLAGGACLWWAARRRTL